MIDLVLLAGLLVGLLGRALDQAEESLSSPVLTPVPRDRLPIYCDGWDWSTVVTIIWPEGRLSKSIAKIYDPTLPPIFVEGRQVRSLGDLRSWLRQRADRLRLDPNLFESSPVPGLGISCEAVWLRCDYRQDARWPEAVMAVCGVLADETLEHAATHCPLISVIQLAVEKVR